MFWLRDYALDLSRKRNEDGGNPALVLAPDPDNPGQTLF